MSLREKILATKPALPVKVNVPEWGEDVYVKTLSAKDFAGMEKDNKDLAGMLVHCLTDKDNCLIFNPDDKEALEGQDVGILLKLAEVFYRLNNLAVTQKENLEKK